MGGVREGVLEGTGERARECWRAQETCAVRQHAGVAAEATSIRARGHRAYASCTRHSRVAPYATDGIGGRPSSGVRGCALG